MIMSDWTKERHDAARAMVKMARHGRQGLFVAELGAALDEIERLTAPVDVEGSQLQREVAAMAARFHAENDALMAEIARLKSAPLEAWAVLRSSIHAVEPYISRTEYERITSALAAVSQEPRPVPACAPEHAGCEHDYESLAAEVKSTITAERAREVAWSITGLDAHWLLKLTHDEIEATRDHIVKALLRAVAGELGRPEPPTEAEARIAEIGRALLTQDNRATDAPLFIVEEKRRVHGFDPAYSDQIAWIDTANDYEEASPEEHARLEAQWARRRPRPDGWTRTAYQDEWHFVTACFTEAGCQEYIRRNGHNHRGELRIYAAGSYRNEEFRAVRAFLIERASRGDTPPEVRPQREATPVDPLAGLRSIAPLAVAALEYAAKKRGIGLNDVTDAMTDEDRPERFGVPVTDFARAHMRQEPTAAPTACWSCGCNMFEMSEMAGGSKYWRCVHCKTSVAVAEHPRDHVEPAERLCVAALVLNAAGEVLLVRTRRGWELPGGKIEGEESPLAAVHREVREETGIEIVWVDESVTVDDAARPCNTSGAATYRVRVFRAYGEGEPKVGAGDNVQLAQWMTPWEVLRRHREAHETLSPLATREVLLAWANQGQEAPE